MAQPAVAEAEALAQPLAGGKSFFLRHLGAQAEEADLESSAFADEHASGAAQLMVLASFSRSKAT